MQKYQLSIHNFIMLFLKSNSIKIKNHIKFIILKYKSNYGIRSTFKLKLLFQRYLNLTQGKETQTDSWLAESGKELNSVKIMVNAFMLNF